MSDQPESFAERRRKFREQKGLPPVDEPEEAKPKPKVEPHPDSDLISDVLYERTPADEEIDKTIQGIGIIAGYRKWIGKEIDESTTNRTEGVMVSCPKPDHRDKNPSAWLNTDDKTWFCGGCQVGGDIYDMAAYGLGFDVPGYKDGQNFHRLREAMAESFGTHLKKVPGGVIAWKEDEGADNSDLGGNDESSTYKEVETPLTPDGGETKEPLKTLETKDPEPTNVTPLHAVPVDSKDEEPEKVNYPTLKWRDIVPPDTFLYEYLSACSIDDSPEEYHLWHGFVALAHAVGRNVTLSDSKPVTGNLLLCLLGGTGQGKSRSRYHLNTILRATLPFKDNGMDTSGCKVVSVPGSGEYLIQQFCHNAFDPSNPKIKGRATPVNGIVDYDEFSQLLSTATRQGSILKPIIMGLADCNEHVTHGSLGRGEYDAYRPFCSIVANTQPRAIRTILSRGDSASGFLNRWIFAGGPPKEKEVIGGVHSAVQIDLARSIDELNSIRGWGGKERSLRVDATAIPEMIKYFRGTIYPLQENDTTDLLKRLDLTVKKLMLLFAINDKANEVNISHFNSAVALVDYIVECYALVNSQIGITLSHEVAEDIKQSIQRHFAKYKKGASPRDLGRYLHRRNYTIEQIKRTLENMVALDMIELEKPKQGTMGRPALRYVIVEQEAN